MEVIMARNFHACVKDFYQVLCRPLDIEVYFQNYMCDITCKHDFRMSHVFIRVVLDIVDVSRSIFICMYTLMR